MIQGFRFYLNPLYLIISAWHLDPEYTTEYQKDGSSRLSIPCKKPFFYTSSSCLLDMEHLHHIRATYPVDKELKWYRISGLSFIHKRLWVVERSKYVLFEGDIMISLINFIQSTVYFRSLHTKGWQFLGEFHDIFWNLMIFKRQKIQHLPTCRI